MSLSNCYKTEVELMCEDVPAKIGFAHQYFGGSPAGFPALDLNTIFVATIIPLLKDVLSSSVQVMRVITRCLLPTDGIPYEANFDETNVGTGSAEPLPPSIALLLKLRCDSPNSRNNGHIYLPGVPEGVWVNGEWEPATFVPIVQTLATAMATMLPPSAAGLSYHPITVSRFENNVKLDPPVTYMVTAVDIGVNVSQQRRRQSGQQGIKT